MKRIWLYTICLGLVGLFACQQEDLPSVGETGFLSLENMTVEMANTESISTRAEENELYVEISSQDVTPEVTLKYNPDSIPSKIELEPGNYTLKAYNAAFNEQSIDKGAAIYYIDNRSYLYKKTFHHFRNKELLYLLLKHNYKDQLDNNHLFPKSNRLFSTPN